MANKMAARGQDAEVGTFLNGKHMQWLAALGVAVAVGIAYFFAARLSLSLLAKPDGVAVFWPP